MISQERFAGYLHKANLVMETSGSSGEEYWSGMAKARLDILGGFVGSELTTTALKILGRTIYHYYNEPFKLVTLNRPHPGFKNGVQVTKIQTMIDCAQSLEAEMVKTKPLEEWKRDGDPRVTRIGGILRRLSLDELPQFYNVEGGVLSLVGPRSFSPVQGDLLNGMRVSSPQAETYLRALESGMKFGMTGLAQIYGRGELAFEQRIQLDALYAENASFKGDLMLLAFTPLATLSLKGAY